MSGFIEIDNNFILPPSFNLESLDSLPIQKHIYGQPIEMATRLYWLEYQLSRPGSGSISFARRIVLEYPDLAKYVVDYLTNLLPDVFLHVEHVQIVKTVGNIYRHIDESNRRSCINIGIKNSNNSTTYSSTTKDYKEFDLVKTKNVCQDNHAYLLDTGSIHEVIGNTQEPRYMIAYGFHKDFQTMKSFLR